MSTKAPDIQARLSLLLVSVLALLSLQQSGLTSATWTGVAVLVLLGAGTCPLLGVSLDMSSPRSLIALIGVLAAVGITTGLVSGGSQQGMGLVLALVAVFPLWWRGSSGMRVGLLVSTLPLVAALGLGEVSQGQANVVICAMAAALALTMVLIERADRASLPQVPPPPQPAGHRPVVRTRWRAPLVVALSVVSVPVALALVPTIPFHWAGLFSSVGQSSNNANGPTRSDLVFGSGVLDLRARGDLPTTPLWTVPQDSPTLWRTQVLDTYDGQTWTVRGAAQGAGATTVQHSDGSYLFQVAGVTATTPWYSVSGLPASISTPGISPGTPVAVRTPATLNPIAGGGFLVQTGPTQNLPAYDIRAQPVPLISAGDQNSTGSQADLDRRWLVLPPLPGRVLDLAASLATGHEAPAALAFTIENYLRNNETYDLDSPVPAPGDDAVDDFLFNSHRGFCEQFAAAEVVLLRANGVAARLATGFAGGESTSDGRRLLRGNDAHAWVELWVPGTGWMASDPTANATLFTSSNPLALGLGLVALVAVLLAAAVAAVIWMLRRPRRSGAEAQDARANHALIDAFRRLEAAESKRGRPRAPQETVASFGTRFGEAEDVSTTFTLVEQQLYSPIDLPAAGVSRGLAVLDRLTADPPP